MDEYKKIKTFTSGDKDELELLCNVLVGTHVANMQHNTLTLDTGVKLVYNPCDNGYTIDMYVPGYFLDHFNRRQETT